MPLLATLLTLFIPRVVIVGLWLFTSWFQGVFGTIFWPLLGFLIMPTTLLWYSAVQNWLQGEWNLIALVVLVFTILLDLSPSSYRRRGTQPV